MSDLLLRRAVPYRTVPVLQPSSHITLSSTGAAGSLLGQEPEVVGDNERDHPGVFVSMPPFLDS